jgi:hypothetical protein
MSIREATNELAASLAEAATIEFVTVCIFAAVLMLVLP